jgi:hypothetical protein
VRRLGLAVAVPVGVLALAITAIAYWTTFGTGAAGATVGTLAAPSVTATSPGPDTAHLEWTAVPAPGGAAGAEVTFTVDRKPSSGSTWVPVCGTGGTPKPYDVLSCDDHPGATDDYDYRVTAHFRTWTSEGTDSVEVVVDTTPPQVTAIARADGSPTNASTVHWTVTFTEDVTGVDATDFALAGSGSSGASITGVTGSGASYAVSAATGADGVLGLDLVDDDSIEDLAANPLGPGDGGLAGEAYVVDRTAPSVSSVVRAGLDPTNAASVAWTVTFDEDVSDVDAADFALATTGLSGLAAVVSVAQIDARHYTVTATTGTGTPTGSGSIRLDVTDDDSIVDGVGNRLGGPGAGNGDFTAGDAYTVDKTQPTVVSILREGTSPTNAGPLQWTVTFSEPVIGVTTANFALISAGLGGTAPTVTSVVPVGGPAPASTWTVEVSTAGTTGANDGSIRLDLTTVGIARDAAANALAGPHLGDQSYVYDTTQPTAVSIVRKPGATSPTNHGPLEFTVTFSEPVGSVTAPAFAATTSNVVGVPSVGAPVPTGPAPSTTWTVALDMTAVTGANTGSVGLSLVSVGSISDAAANVLAGTRPGDEAFAYDTTAPTVTSIDRAGGSPTNAGTVSWTVSFSEAVGGVGLGDFVLSQGGGVSGASITGVTGSGPYTVTATTGTGDGTLGLTLADDDSIVDTAANTLGGPGAGNGGFTGQEFTIDRTKPTVTVEQKVGQADPTNGLPIRFTVTFSEPVTGFDAGDVSRSGTSGGGALTVTGSGASYEIAVAGGPTNGTVVVAVAAGGASDAAGNTNLASTSTDNTVIYDTVAPTVTVDQSAGQADPTSAAPVSFTVVFSEPVTGFAGGDVTLGGTAGATTATVTGGPTTFNLAVSGMTGAGTVTAAVVVGAAQDAAGNASVASTSTDDTVTYTLAAPWAGIGWSSPVLTGGGTFTCDYAVVTAVTCTASGVGNKGSFTANVRLLNASQGPVSNSTGATIAVAVTTSGEVDAGDSGPTGALTIAPAASTTPGTYTLTLKPGNSVATVTASVTYGGATYTVNCVVSR